jgi:hypothetical protein
MGKTYPEIPDYLKRMMQDGEELDEIRIDSEGHWFHNGISFKNKKIISFFNKSIDITRDGVYVLNYSGFVYPLIVEDAPLFITGFRLIKNDDEESVLIALNSGEVETLDLNTLHFKNNALYCFVKNGEILAKFKRSPSYELLQDVKDNDDIYYLELCGRRIVLSEKVESEL